MGNTYLKGECPHLLSHHSQLHCADTQPDAACPHSVVCSFQLSSSLSQRLCYLGAECSQLLFAVTPIVRGLLTEGPATHC